MLAIYIVFRFQLCYAESTCAAVYISPNKYTYAGGTCLLLLLIYLTLTVMKYTVSVHR